MLSSLFGLLGAFGAIGVVGMASGSSGGSSDDDDAPAKSKNLSPPETQPRPDPVPPVDVVTPVEQETPSTPDEPETPSAPVEAQVPVTPGDIELPDQGSESTDGRDGEDVSSISDDLGEVTTGRVTTVQPVGDDIASVRVTQGLEHGNVTVNPDNTLALVLSTTDYTGALSFQYEVTDSTGAVQTHDVSLDAIAGPVSGGWGKGDFYMLETDHNGDIVVEWGDNHRDVYMSGSSDALTKADIATIHGLAPEKITGEWLANHPEYGSSEELALAEDSGRELWAYLGIETIKEPASHWLHLEAGYSYDTGTFIGMWGESELHPVHITSYGEGPAPLIEEQINSFKYGFKNVVFSDVEFTNGVRMIDSDNVIFENSTFTGAYLTGQSFSGLTLRNSEVYDVFHDDPVTDANFWDPAPNRTSGLYTNYLEGLLIENTLFDHNGWADGYEEDLSLDGGMPPSMYSHNVYLGGSTTDVTIRDSIMMRGASHGAQVRGGGFLEDNVFLDNNTAVFVNGGTGDDGNYSLYADNLTTSGGHREAEQIGYLASGMGDFAKLNTHLDNVVAHLADPNNPDEQAAKVTANNAIDYARDVYYFDTIVYNWEAVNNGSPDLNTEGLDTAVLDATTIQNYTAQLLGKETATIDDLADYLRAKGPELFEGKTDAEMIIEFFQAGFGLTPNTRLTAETLRFVPNDLADGIRWDNRINWSTEDLPGTIAGDSVDLAGNWVYYGGTTEIEDMDFGDGGRLTVTHGRLDILGETTTEGEGAQLDIDESGQVWINGYSAEANFDIDVAGGRFANTGDFDGLVDLTAMGGQTLLATEGARFDVDGGSRLTIDGDEGKVGFEGVDGDTAVLRFGAEGTARFEVENGKLGSIEEFRSGHNGDQEVNVASGVNFGEGILEIDLAGLDTAANDYELISVDEMVGAFSEINVTGLSGARNAQIVFDYEKDQVVLSIGEEGQGSGLMDISVLGDQNDAQSNTELWNALTEGYTPLGDQIPDEVTLDEEVLDIAV